MKKAITCASRRTVFCIVALLAISACLGIMAAVLHRPRPAATGLSIRMNDQKIRLFDTPEEALSAAAEAPAAAEENRLRLSWEGGALTHNAICVRRPRENRGCRHRRMQSYIISHRKRQKM